MASEREITYKYPWIYSRADRSPDDNIVACYDCRLPYPEGNDCVIDNEIWDRISPTGGEGGILCANCMIGRLHFLDIYNVEARLW